MTRQLPSPFLLTDASTWFSTHTSLRLQFFLALTTLTAKVFQYFSFKLLYQLFSALQINITYIVFIYIVHFNFPTTTFQKLQRISHLRHLICSKCFSYNFSAKESVNLCLKMLHFQFYNYSLEGHFEPMATDGQAVTQPNYTLGALVHSSQSHTDMSSCLSILKTPNMNVSKVSK